LSIIIIGSQDCGIIIGSQDCGIIIIGSQDCGIIINYNYRVARLRHHYRVARLRNHYTGRETAESLYRSRDCGIIIQVARLRNYYTGRSRSRSAREWSRSGSVCASVMARACEELSSRAGRTSRSQGGRYRLSRGKSVGALDRRRNGGSLERCLGGSEDCRRGAGSLRRRFVVHEESRFRHVSPKFAKCNFGDHLFWWAGRWSFGRLRVCGVMKLGRFR
jgi:hypothetical protein